MTATRTANGLVTCEPATSDIALAAHHAIRHEVFVVEQSIFAGSDRDVHDDDPAVIRLLASYQGVPAGSVRLFRLESGVWQGDRLAVLRPYRIHGVGAPLVRCAVATAGAHGGSAMVAHIQLPNVAFFTHLGWRLDGELEIYAGRPHQPMAITLPAPGEGARIVQELREGVSARDGISDAAR